MRVFKFGGASVKDAHGVKNVASVLGTQGFDNCLLVVSAMGKTTNALERVVEAYWAKSGYEELIRNIKKDHISIATELFEEGHPVFGQISLFFGGVEAFLKKNKSSNYSFVYDQVVSCGEMVSSKILSAYLDENNYCNTWIDARDYIKTNSNYREGTVDWEKTEQNISTLIPSNSYVTQGFIGSDGNNFTVTLGREGSDYSAAIFAYCMNAEAMTIWKDVPGVMTGDPRKFEEVALLTDISYEEAIEMAYYGASVIHPKTLQPLKQKNIPFYVKSFVEPQKPGTKIGAAHSGSQYVESYILKEGQVLLRISTRDFSFIAEEHLSFIFSLLAKFKIKISLMQNSAISLALCLEDKYGNSDELEAALRQEFKTEVTKEVKLFTVRNADLETMNRFYEGKNILLEQILRKTLQMVIKD